MKKQLKYEEEMEIRELNRPVINQPDQKKDWQENLPLYITITIVAAVIAGLIIFAITNGLFLRK